MKSTTKFTNRNARERSSSDPSANAGPNELPDLLDERRVADLLHVRPCTVRNERQRGKLGFIHIGARIFYTTALIAEYLQRQEVTACAGNPEGKRRAKLVTIGSPKTPIARERATLGVEPGTIDQAVRHAVLALAQQTFRRRASSSQTGSSGMAKANPISGPTKS